jgi:GNAT superfamily N-acetyltransferase
MPEPERLPVRQYRAGDEAQLVALFAAVFGRSIDEPHWLWKLRHATSPAPNVLLAMSGERPVFQYAGIPVSFLLNGSRADGMVSVDTMTAPDFRRRGLLTQVAGEAYARWRDAGVQFVIGLPNEQWGSRTRALGWVPLFGLQRLVRPLRPEVMLAHRVGLPWLRHLAVISAAWNGLVAPRLRRDPSIQTCAVSQADEEFDELWDKCRQDAKFSVIRDRAWVQWRFMDCPRRYQVLLARRDGVPVGYCAWRVDESQGRRRAFLAELVAARDEPNVLQTLLAELVSGLQEQRAEYLLTLAPPGTRLHRLLRKQGFFAGASFSVEMVPLAAGLPLGDLACAHHWQLSGAAFDVI